MSYREKTNSHCQVTCRRQTKEHPDKAEGKELVSLLLWLNLIPPPLPAGKLVPIETSLQRHHSRLDFVPGSLLLICKTRGKIMNQFVHDGDLSDKTFKQNLNFLSFLNQSIPFAKLPSWMDMVLMFTAPLLHVRVLYTREPRVTDEYNWSPKRWSGLL